MNSVLHILGIGHQYMLSHHLRMFKHWFCSLLFFMILVELQRLDRVIYEQSQIVADLASVRTYSESLPPLQQQGQLEHVAVIVCPVKGCTYTTGHVDANVAVALLGLHAVDHNTLPTQTGPKVERVKRPNISSAGINENWAYFHICHHYHEEPVHPL